MPVLDITNGHGQLLPDAGLRMLGCAYYPRQDHTRSRVLWLASALVMVYREARLNPNMRSRVIELESEAAKLGIDAPKTGVLPAITGKDQLKQWGELALEYLPDLWDAKQAPYRIFSDGSNRCTRGLVAGMILNFRIACCQHHREHTQCYKSVETLEVVFQGLAKAAPLDHDLPLSRTSIDHAWADFKSFAHLFALVEPWASWRPSPFLQSSLVQPYDYSKQLGLGYDDSEELRSALDAAESLRVTAVELGLFSAQESWECPADLDLRPSYIEVAPLPDWAVQYLDGGRPLP